MAHEENFRTEDGKTYVDVNETKTYEVRTIKAPFGFTKTYRVEVKPKDSKAEDTPAEKKKLTKKQKLGIGGLLIAGLLGGAAIKRHHDAQIEDNEDYDDDQDIEDVDEEDDYDEDSED